MGLERDIAGANAPTARGILYEIGEDGEVVSDCLRGAFRGKFLE